MGETSASGGSRGNDGMDPTQLLGRLNREEDELDNLVSEDEVTESEEKPKWLSLSWVLTEKTFSQGGLIGDMWGLESRERGGMEEDKP